MGSSVALKIPFAGIFYSWFGIKPVGPNYFKDYMKNELNLAIMPGGFEEATLTNHE